MRQNGKESKEPKQSAQVPAQAWVLSGLIRHHLGSEEVSQLCFDGSYETSECDVLLGFPCKAPNMLKHQQPSVWERDSKQEGCKRESCPVYPLKAERVRDTLISLTQRCLMFLRLWLDTSSCHHPPATNTRSRESTKKWAKARSGLQGLADQGSRQGLQQEEKLAS